MCGIAGTLGGSLSPNDFGKILEQAGNTIAHRGPDDMGIWFDKETAIGHRSFPSRASADAFSNWAFCDYI